MQLGSQITQMQLTNCLLLFFFICFFFFSFIRISFDRWIMRRTNPMNYNNFSQWRWSTTMIYIPSEMNPNPSWSRSWSHMWFGLLFSFLFVLFFLSLDFPFELRALFFSEIWFIHSEKCEIVSLRFVWIERGRIIIVVRNFQLKMFLQQ